MCQLSIISIADFIYKYTGITNSVPKYTLQLKLTTQFIGYRRKDLNSVEWSSFYKSDLTWADFSNLS